MLLFSAKIKKMIKILFAVCILSIQFAQLRCNLDLSNIEFQKVNYKHCNDSNCKKEFPKKITGVYSISKEKEYLYYMKEDGSVTLGLLDKPRGMITDAICEFKSEDGFKVSQLFDEVQDGVHLTLGGVFTMVGSFIVFQMKRLVYHLCRKNKQKQNNEIRRLILSNLHSHSYPSNFSHIHGQTHSESNFNPSFNSHISTPLQAESFGDFNTKNFSSSTKKMNSTQSPSINGELTFVTPAMSKTIQLTNNNSKPRVAERIQKSLERIYEENESSVNQLFCDCYSKCKTNNCPCKLEKLKCTMLCHNKNMKGRDKCENN